MHQRAASYFLAHQIHDQVIYHALQAEDYAQVAAVLKDHGAKMLKEGRLDSLAAYLAEIPPEILAVQPFLLFMMGDLARLLSRFQEALGWYQQAERLWRESKQMGSVGRALRGQARVYLDTVNPSMAESLLQQAIRISDRIEDIETQARLYELLSENKLNAGKLAEAEDLRQQAQALRLEGPADEQLQFRVLLRTGRLDEARQKLEASAAYEEENPVQTPRGHRETLLLLSLINVLQGDVTEALQAADAGMARAIQLDAPFMLAVAHMRQGHALNLQIGENKPELARQQYQKAIEISKNLSIPRLRVEAAWGLCRAFGYRGRLKQARPVAEEGLRIADEAGDEWVASMIRIAMGAGLVLNGEYQAAVNWLETAASGFDECSDPFGATAARMWLALNAFQSGDHDLALQLLQEVLLNSIRYGYGFLFTRPTLLGPNDERLLVPLLLFAKRHDLEVNYIDDLLDVIGLPDIQAHPGYQLRIKTLGDFQVSRGRQGIIIRDWRRKKAREMFQLFVTYRESPLPRDQIFEYLWPEMTPDAAARNFKVALNALMNALEPDRAAGADSVFIVRDGILYGLRADADIWIDAQAFSAHARAAENAKGEATLVLLERAVNLYQGEYLPEVRYETWAATKREHLSVKFLQTADKLCEVYLEQNNPQAVVALCQRILNFDDCWERAYRHLMLAHDRLGDRGQIARTYQRCVENLRQELDVEPTSQTVDLYNQLTAK